MYVIDVIIAVLSEKSALNLILSFAVPFISTFILHFLMYKLLPNRLNIYGLLVLSLIYSMWHTLCISELFGTTYHLFMNIFINAFTYFIVIFLFIGKFWKKLIVWWYFDIIKTLCQAVSYVPVLLVQSSREPSIEWGQVVESVLVDTSMRFLHMAVYLPLFLLVGFLALPIWRKILMQKFNPFYILFFALPLGQIYSLSNVIHPNMGDWIFGVVHSFTADVQTAYHVSSILGLAVSVAASIAILVYILSYDKRAAVEAELHEAKRAMELTQAEHSKINDRREEMEMIRHDFNNQLSSIIQLVRVGEDETAQGLISSLTNEINKTHNS